MSTELDQIDERLAELLEERDKFDEDETILSQELEESEAAWQDYLAGRDPGMSLEEVKLKLFGKKVE